MSRCRELYHLSPTGDGKGIGLEELSAPRPRSLLEVRVVRKSRKNRRLKDHDPYLPNPWAAKSGPVGVRQATEEERKRFGIYGSQR